MLKYSNNVKKFDKYNRKIRINIDKDFLIILVNYVLKNSSVITKKNYLNLKKLIEILDFDLFKSDAEKCLMLEFIYNALVARLEHSLSSKELILTYCLEINSEYEFIKEKINIDSINLRELKWINKAIIDRLQFAYISFYKDILFHDFESFSSINESIKDKDYKKCVSIIKEDLTHLLAEMRSTSNIDTDKSFTLEDNLFDDMIISIVNKLKDDRRRFVTGIKALNNILSPGFLSGRLYMFLARTGNFKSGLLLHIAIWLKRYSKHITARRNPDAIPTVLLITTENSIEETVERMFSIVVPDKSIHDLSPTSVIKELKQTGKMTLETNNKINIRIEYRNDREIDTNDIYGIIEDIEMHNAEVIALIVDYIKRIRAADSSQDERIELKNCSSELKNLAENLDIPVITAMQINRSGNNLVEEAMNKQKVDVAKLLGAGNVANCWDLIENSDWVCIINIEKHPVEKDYYLAFKLVKIRYADSSNSVTYFNHPFADGDKIRLIDDYKLEESLSLKTLVPDIIEEPKDKKRKKNKFDKPTDVSEFFVGSDK